MERLAFELPMNFESSNIFMIISWRFNPVGRNSGIHFFPSDPFHEFECGHVYI